VKVLAKMFGSPIAMCQWSSRLNLKPKKYYVECRWYMAWMLDVVDALVL